MIIIISTFNADYRKIYHNEETIPLKFIVPNLNYFLQIILYNITKLNTNIFNLTLAMRNMHFISNIHVAV